MHKLGLYVLGTPRPEEYLTEYRQTAPLITDRLML